MTFEEYDTRASCTAIYPQKYGVIYPVLGLVGEAGEVAEKVKKTIRDKDAIFDEGVRKAIASELGDVLWYLSATAREIGLSLDDIACLNIEKIESRNKRNALHGEGDSR